MRLHDLEQWKARLWAALTSDVRSVRDQNGEEITYRSTREIELALDRVEGEIRRTKTNPPNTIIFSGV
jgi:hypothetical protein